MLMLYNSDNFAVVQIDVPSASGAAEAGGAGLSRGGYEIVDKFARKEIFLEGALAESFKNGVQALIEGDPSEEEIDAYIGRYTSLMQQPVVLH
jgi:hypothetical protein